MENKIAVRINPNTQIRTNQGTLRGPSLTEIGDQELYDATGYYFLDEDLAKQFVVERHADYAKTSAAIRAFETLQRRASAPKEEREAVPVPDSARVHESMLAKAQRGSGASHGKGSFGVGAPHIIEGDTQFHPRINPLTGELNPLASTNA